MGTSFCLQLIHQQELVENPLSSSNCLLVAVNYHILPNVGNLHGVFILLI